MHMHASGQFTIIQYYSHAPRKFTWRHSHAFMLFTWCRSHTIMLSGSSQDIQQSGIQAVHNTVHSKARIQGSSQDIPSHAFRHFTRYSQSACIRQITRHSQSYIQKVHKTFPVMYSSSSQDFSQTCIQSVHKIFPEMHSGISKDIPSHPFRHFARHFQSCIQAVSRMILSCIQSVHKTYSAILSVMHPGNAHDMPSHVRNSCIPKRFPPCIWAVPRLTVAKSRKNLSRLGNHDKSLFCFICPGVQVLWRSLVFLCDLPQKHLLFTIWDFSITKWLHTLYFKLYNIDHAFFLSLIHFHVTWAIKALKTNKLWRGHLFMPDKIQW